LFCFCSTGELNTGLTQVLYNLSYATNQKMSFFFFCGTGFCFSFKLPPSKTMKVI
jgi:hypothetical protein